MSEIHGQKSQIESVAARKLEMEQARTVLENLRNLLDELSGRRSLMPVFGDLSRRMPESIVLTSCQLYEPIFSDYSVIDLDSGMDPDSPAALANTLASAARDTAQDVVPEHRGLKLVGVASTIPDIINLAAELDRSPLFFQVDMEIKEPTVYLGQPARRFEVRCRLMPQREAGA